MHLPNPNTPILIHFQPLLTQPSYHKMVLLVMGTLSARGNHTVSAALKMLGLEQERNYSKYHNLLNRAKYSPLSISRVLLQLLLTAFVSPNAPVEVVIDETLERRWGDDAKLVKRVIGVIVWPHLMDKILQQWAYAG